jgi:hypothetical protein
VRKRAEDRRDREDFVATDAGGVHSGARVLVSMKGERVHTGNATHSM